jgi:hypothetical protein
MLSKKENCRLVHVGVIIFGSVRFLSKKLTKPKFFFFEKKTETESKPGQTDRFRFGSVRFLGKKPVQTGLARFFLVLARFFRFGSVFFRFRFGSVFSVFCL